MAQVPSPNIASSTKGATIMKQGQTTSGRHGTSITKKSSTSAKEVNPKG